VQTGSADDDGTGGLEPVDNRSGLGGLLAVERRAGGRGAVRVIDQVFETDRHPGQRPRVPTRGNDGIEVQGPGQGTLVIQVGECVQVALSGVGCIEGILNSVDG